MTIEMLTAQDRCDACGAQAYIQVIFVRGQLYFCNHHYNEQKEILQDLAVDINDESHRLLSNKTEEEDVQ